MHKRPSIQGGPVGCKHSSMSIVVKSVNDSKRIKQLIILFTITSSPITVKSISNHTGTPKASICIIANLTTTSSQITFINVCIKSIHGVLAIQYVKKVAYQNRLSYQNLIHIQAHSYKSLSHYCQCSIPDCNCYLMDM